MTDESFYLDAFKIIGLCILWYGASASNNIIGKMVLTEFPYPMTVTMVQLLSIYTYLVPILSCQNVRLKGKAGTHLSKKYYFTVIIPLALGKFISSVSSHISIWKVSVSYAHTVKATLPLFTVILSRVILGEKQTLIVYLSLLPIICGVVIATMTELSFDLLGLLSALFATVGFSLQTIFSKKCLKDTGIHHLYLLIILARWSTICFLPLWLLYDVRRILGEDILFINGKISASVFLLLLDGFFNMLQNLIAFTVLALMTSLSYAVANAMKRVIIITASIIMLQNPVTPMNCFGMLVSIIGVLLYNKAKYDQNRARHRESILPRVRSDTKLSVKLQSLSHSKSDIDLPNRNLVLQLMQQSPGNDFSLVPEPTNAAGAPLSVKRSSFTTDGPHSRTIYQI